MDVTDPAYKQQIGDLPKIKLDQSKVIAHESENQEESSKCSNAIKRVPKSSDPKKLFWVHVNDASADDCQKYIDDLRGKPYFSDLNTHECPLCSDEQGQLRPDSLLCLFCSVVFDLNRCKVDRLMSL
jgi:hypothetical protein